MANNGDIVVMNDRLRMAVGNALSASPRDIQEAARRRRNSLDSVIPSSGGGPVQYSGYFALRLVQVSGAYRVRIVDGATYDATAGTSGDSIATVNEVTFNVPYYESGDLTVTSIFALKYTYDPVNVTGEIEIVNGESLPSGTSTTSYYYLGRAILNSGAWSIAQGHGAFSGNGVAAMTFYVLCGS